MKMYIFICARVQRKKKTCIHILQVYFLQLYILQLENWNKTNALVNVKKKKGNTPRKWWFKSNQLIKRIHVLTSFCLASDPQNVSLACRSIWKRPNSRQPVFRPEIPPAPSTRKRPVREAKFKKPVETQTLTFTSTFQNVILIYIITSSLWQLDRKGFKISF